MTMAMASAGVRVNAVASACPERAAAFAKSNGIAAGSSDLQSVLGRADVDAVYVANAPKQHAATVIAALRAGKAVLCEKPMATSEAEMVAIIKAAEQTGLLCMEAIWTLCLPTYRRFFDYARSGDWGEPKSLIASFSYPIGETDDEKAIPAERAGVLLDRGIYLVALALSVFGGVKEITTQIQFDVSGTDTAAFLQLEHHTGAHSQLAASFDCLMPNNASLHCSRGMLEIQSPLIGSEMLSTRKSDLLYTLSQKDERPSFAKNLKQRLRRSPGIRRLKRTLDQPTCHHFAFGDSGYAPQLGHFLALLDGKKAESDIVPLKLSLEIIQIIDQARKISIV
jgi:predicted dehydrogenase